MANEYFVNSDDLTAVANAIRTKGETTESLVFPGGFVSAIGDISTGVELNYEVIGGTSQPSNPTENTIWVNTSTTISSYIFSASQPSSPSSDMVWIKVSGNSNAAFNALKTNGIYVYPNSAKQFVGGVWVDKTVKIYQNGEWADLLMYLYSYGNEFTELTGGWKAVYPDGTTSNAQNTSDGLYAKKTSSYGAYINNWYTSNKIDVTNLKTIYARFVSTVAHANGNEQFIRLLLHTNNTDAENQCTGITAAHQVAAANEEIVISIDVSSITGSYYVKLNHQGGGGADVWWREVWAE